MNSLLKSVVAGLLVSTGVCAQQGCDRPWPAEIPEIAVNKDEMLTVQREVKQYLKDAEAYLACNDTAQQEVPADAAASAQTLKILTRMYNNTVDEMQVVGDQFNVLVRKYKKATS